MIAERWEGSDLNLKLTKIGFCSGKCIFPTEMDDLVASQKCYYRSTSEIPDNESNM